MPLTLTATGDLRLRNHSRVVLGNIHDTRLEDLLPVPYVDRFFSTVPGFCAGCEDYPGCRGGCRAVSEQMGVPLDRHDPAHTTVRR